MTGTCVIRCASDEIYTPRSTSYLEKTTAMASSLTRHRTVAHLHGMPHLFGRVRTVCFELLLTLLTRDWTTLRYRVGVIWPPVSARRFRFICAGGVRSFETRFRNFLDTDTRRRAAVTVFDASRTLTKDKNNYLQR